MFLDTDCLRMTAGPKSFRGVQEMGPLSEREMVCEQARVQVRRASDEVQKMPTCSSRLPALKVTNSSLFLIIAGLNHH